MSTTDTVASIAAPLVEAEGAALYDVEYNGGVLRISIDHADGVDMDLIAAVSRSISRALDEADPISSGYTLEVSSPGIERKLRVPAHFQSAVGELVQIKLRPGVPGDRRLDGTLVAATDADVTIRKPAGDEVTVEVADITRAQVVHDWDSQPQRPTSTERNEATS